MAGIWTQSPPNSMFRTIFEKNMDDSSFNYQHQSVEKTINLPHEAVFIKIGEVLRETEFACKVNI